MKELNNREIIKKEDYLDKIMEIIRLNYHYISITSELLMYIIRKNNYSINDDIELLFSRIESTDTTLESAIIVLANFIKSIWIESIEKRTKMIYLDLSLKTLTRYRGFRGTMDEFIKVLERTMTLLYLQFSDISKNIGHWIKSQKIIY